MLNKLKEELLDAEPDACLPRNLSEEWLHLLSKAAETILKDQIEAGPDDEAIIVAVIVRILHAKTLGQTEPVMIPYEDLYEYIHLYQIELAFGAAPRI